jgi:hypothetical protein
MAEVLFFFKNNEVFIYLILGVLAAWQMYKFTQAWDDLRSAAFGLEQESARNRLNWAASILVIIIILGIAEFGLVSLVIPGIPDASPLPTPTLDLLATATITLAPEESVPEASQATIQATIPAGENNCEPGQLEITSPQSGDTIQDIVEIYGTADISNFGFYKFEIAATNNPTWLTIQAGDIPVKEGFLGYWDTTRLAPGEYSLRLIITDNQGNASQPCSIRVNVSSPAEP